MTTSYINPKEFDRQLTEKKLTLKDVAEILTLEINHAKDIFAGYKSIPEIEILKLHELMGFVYLDLITSEKTINENKPIKIVRPKKHSSNNNHSILKNTYLDIDEKASCEKCNFLINNPVNYCPNCGELLPQLIRDDKTIPNEK
ncbi:hypothetical protein [Labilibaculum antarcticum]|uniref:Zinc ribbon domain-containing protein n=1 Tax=Labilibaculum antarcticum TaxID=1717717 RepID=A0A1Y1CNW4_9BACT|nr:hypothetical protein [Labilibaculum antarcticum]BAX82097.1 zinc ribbon domain-containing protein [Labilibaculum antarcticum]